MADDWLWQHLRTINRAAFVNMNSVRNALDDLNDDCGNCLGRRDQEWLDSVYSGTPQDLCTDDGDAHLWYHIERINAFAANDRGLGDVKDELDEIARMSGSKLRNED